MVLREVVVMNARAEMYLKFIEKRIKVGCEVHNMFVFQLKSLLIAFKEKKRQ